MKSRTVVPRRGPESRGRLSAAARRNDLRLFAMLGVAMAAGCLAPDDSRPSTVAKQLMPKEILPGRHDVLMDIVHVERPFGDRLLNEDIWQPVDEQQLDGETRQALEEHGFRVGILGGPLPAGLDVLLKEETQEPNGRHFQVPSGTPTQVNISGPMDAWPTDLDRKPGMEQSPYRNVITSIRVVPTILPGGLVDISVTPEILHGDAVPRPDPRDEGLGTLNWSVRVRQQIRSLDDLTFSLRIQPGQRILLTCVPAHKEGIGAYFFGRTQTGHSAQRMILLQAEAPAATDFGQK